MRRRLRTFDSAPQLLNRRRSCSTIGISKLKPVSSVMEPSHRLRVQSLLRLEARCLRLRRGSHLANRAQMQGCVGNPCFIEVYMSADQISVTLYIVAQTDDGRFSVREVLSCTLNRFGWRGRFAPLYGVQN
jgi:hypothetical protein